MTTTGPEGEPPGAGNPTRSRRVPHVISDLAEVHAAVEKLLEGENFVVDVECRERTGDPNPRTNSLTWLGLGGHGQAYVIPVDHPKGRVIQGKHKEKTPAFVFYGADDERSYTKLGKPSFRMVEHTVEATYAKRPPQLSPAEVIDAVKPLLLSDRGKVGHNTKYDLETLAKYLGEIPPGPYHDTVIIEHILREEGPQATRIDYGLKPLTYSPWPHGFGVSKTHYPELGKQGPDNFGLDEIARYLTKDLHYCWLRFVIMMERLRRKNLMPVYDFEMSVYPVVMDIEQTGFAVDKGNLDAAAVDLRDQIQKIEHQAWSLAGDSFPLSNLNAKRWVLFGEGDEVLGEHGLPLKTQKLRVLGRTEVDRVPQVTKAVLTFHADRGNKMADHLLNWSALEKVRGTFIDGLDRFLVPTDELPRVHPSFKHHGTMTGRFSCGVPNLQQLPKRGMVRSLFVANRGRILIVADYDQIELRCLAHQAREQTMVKVFKRGEDIHKQAAVAMFRIPLERVTEVMRDTGKTANFGTAYGAGPERIAAVAGVSVREGQEFLDRYYQQFSGLRPWKAKLLREARQRGDRANIGSQPPHVIIPPVGRLRRLPDLYIIDPDEEWKKWRAERQAVNAVIQGFAAYIMKMAMKELAPALADYDAYMVVQVHDEIVVDAPERHGPEVLDLVTNTMSGIKDALGMPILGEIPLLVSAALGSTWASAKGK